MKAIISDIHANLEALDAVLDDARAQGCTHYVCLGDVVGYNADPAACVEVVRQLDCPTVKGNHDAHASIDSSTEGFNELAERAINWTRANLDDTDKHWLQQMRIVRQVRDFTIVHATLDTPDQWGYVLNNLDAVASFTYQHTNVCFFGHTHVPVAYVRDSHVARVAFGELHLQPHHKYFINAGSVGQPRDGDWRACYCIYDVDEQRVELRRVKYDLVATQKKIRAAGLPPKLAERLGAGR